MRRVSLATAISGLAAKKMARNEAHLLTTGKAAELLGVTPDTVLRWVRKGRLSAHYTAGGHCRIRFRDLEPLMNAEASDLAPAMTGPRCPTLFCWEYLNPGKAIPEECKSCIVYRARVTWCFRLAELERGIGHSRRFCPTSCEECAYYRRANHLPTNILVISSDQKLISSLAAEESRGLSLRYARNSYAASAMIQDFRPGFVILDEDICRVESELVDCLATDPRTPGVRIILAARRVIQGGATGRPESIAAVLEKPFGIDRIEQVIGTIPIQRLPGSMELGEEDHTDAS